MTIENDTVDHEAVIRDGCQDRVDRAADAAKLKVPRRPGESEGRWHERVLPVAIAMVVPALTERELLAFAHLGFENALAEGRVSVDAEGRITAVASKH